MIEGPALIRMDNNGRLPADIEKNTVIGTEQKPRAKLVADKKSTIGDSKQSTATGKTSASSSGVSTPVKKKRKSPAFPWKKPKDMPKRPLSAYNLFFKAERNRLLKKNAGLEIKDSTSHKEESNDTTASGGPKRQHVKASGIGFANLAKTIAASWKKADKATRAPFEARAAVDKKRYDRAVSEWRAKQDKASPSTKKAKTIGQATSSPTSLSRVDAEPGVQGEQYPHEWFETNRSEPRIPLHVHTGHSNVFTPYQYPYPPSSPGAVPFQPRQYEQGNNPYHQVFNPGHHHSMATTPVSSHSFYNSFEEAQVPYTPYFEDSNNFVPPTPPRQYQPPSPLSRGAHDVIQPVASFHSDIFSASEMPPEADLLDDHVMHPSSSYDAANQSGGLPSTPTAPVSTAAEGDNNTDGTVLRQNLDDDTINFLTSMQF